MNYKTKEINGLLILQLIELLEKLEKKSKKIESIFDDTEFFDSEISLLWKIIQNVYKIPYDDDEICELLYDFGQGKLKRHILLKNLENYAKK